MPDVNEEMKQEFLAEAQDILDQISDILRNLEQDLTRGQPRPDRINQLFRNYHSLKGLSGMLGFQRISHYTHALEDLLDRVRLGKRVLDEGLLEFLQNTVNIIHTLLQEIAKQKEELDLERLIQEVQEQADRGPMPSATEDALDVLDLDEKVRKSLTEYEEHRLRENIRSGSTLYSITLLLDLNNFDHILREVNAILNEHGELISTLPSYDKDLDPSKMRFRLLFASTEPPEVIHAYLPVEPESYDVIYERTRSEATPAGEAIKEPPETVVSSQEPGQGEAPQFLRDLSRFVRVDIEYLDELMNILGEMFIIRSQFDHQIKMLRGRDSEIDRNLNSVLRLNHELYRKLGEAQRRVLEMRLVPIATIYGRLDRLIRQLARQFNKKIESQLLGGGTKLDKVVMEHLIDPLIHIIRNAIDHGIEPPEERRQRGKPETGLIRIEASHQGNNIVLKISDDGRGIQIDRIRQRALELGFLEDREDLTQQEILQALFMPGFSSAETVTEVSGRGVGLDIVKKMIGQLNGSISVFTEPGQGTTFEIILPITLAIISAVLVRVEDQTFAIPLSSVMEIVTVQSDSIQHVSGREVLRYHDDAVPLIRLRQLFQLERGSEPGFAVVSRLGRQPFAILVDEILRMQEIVIKRLARRMDFLPGISGAAEVGEERPVLVIDPPALIERTLRPTVV